MNLVVVKHESCGQKYLFQLPGDHILNAGDLVRVRTKKGKESIATCVCDNFHVSEGATLDCIMEAWGATKPLSYVIGRYNYESLEEINNESAERLCN